MSRRVSVQDAIHEGRNGGEDQIEEDEHPGIGHDAPRETTEELIPEQQIHIHLWTERGRDKPTDRQRLHQLHSFA